MRSASRSLRLAVGLAVWATTLVVEPSAVAAEPVMPGNGIQAGIQLRKDLSDLCLVARAGSGERPVEQTPCADFSDQDWTFTWVGDWFHIRNLDRNMCIVTRGTGETPAVVTNCDSRYPDQLWRWWYSPYHDAYQLENKNSGLCLVARFASQATQTICQPGYSDQRWRFVLS